MSGSICFMLLIYFFFLMPGLATFTHMWFQPWLKPRLKPGWAKPPKPTSWAKLGKTNFLNSKNASCIHILLIKV